MRELNEKATSRKASGKDTSRECKTIDGPRKHKNEHQERGKTEKKAIERDAIGRKYGVSWMQIVQERSVWRSCLSG